MTIRLPRVLRRHQELVIVALFAAVVRIGFALLVTHPSYTDSYYYAAVAKSLARGDGFTIDSIWNFVELRGQVPAPGRGRLPIPSNTHWMPLASIIQWPFLAVFGEGFRAAQAPFLILGVIVPVLAAYVGMDLFRSRRVALGAGVLATFAGSLTAYWNVVENFSLFGVLGALALIACGKGVRGSANWFASAGLWTGLGALGRIDGFFLWLPIAFTFVASRRWACGAGPAGEPVRPLPWGSLAAAAGLFALAFGPWLARNLDVYGAPFPSAGRSTLLMRSYNDLYSLSADLSPKAYLDWGIRNIARSKLLSLSLVTLNLAGVLSIVLLPLFGIGAWRERRRRELWPFFLYAGFVFVMVWLVFTAHAPRGYFIHCAAAWVPFLFPISIVGFDEAVARLGASRGWIVPRARRNLGRMGLAGLVLTGAIEGWFTARDFDRLTLGRVRPVAEFLATRSRPEDVILCVDPPTYTAITGRRCVITPYDGLDVLETVAKAYRPAFVAFDREATVPAGVEVMKKRRIPPWLSPAPVFVTPLVWLYAVDQDALDPGTGHAAALPTGD